MEGAHVIDVNDLVIFMQSRRDEKKSEFPLIQRIRRVPCEAGDDIYGPNVVSVGPYHHASGATLEIEKVKWECLGYILELNPEKKMRDYLMALSGLEEQIRNCYADGIATDSDELLKMMLLDACFLLYIFYGIEEDAQPISRFNALNMDDGNIGLEQTIHTSASSSGEDVSRNVIDHGDAMGNTYPLRLWYTSFHAHDLLLLENQIPFLVVTKIYELVTDGNSPITVLLENVTKFMEDLLVSYPKAIPKFDHPKEVHHLLHLCHQYFKPEQIEIKLKSSLMDSTYFGTSCENEAQTRTTGQQLLGWHQASEYHKAGIELKKQEFCTDNPQSLLDIRFSKDVLEIPCLTVDPNTHCLFRNLLSFEETCPQFGNYNTYVIFLSQFISTPEDVSLLTKRGIIANQLDSDAEVSNIFKMLAEGVNFDINSDHYLKHIFHEMEVHYQMKRPRWRGWFDSISSKSPG